jgi:hypothetical protein
VASSLREMEEFARLSPSDPLYIHQDPMPVGSDIMTQQEAISELSNREMAARAAGTVSPFESSWNPTNPNFRATAQNAISNMLGGSNISSSDNYLGGRVANTLTSLLDFAPWLGDGMGIGDTMTSYRQGDMLGTGINAAATGIGVLPLVGGPASKAVKAGGNRVRSALRARGVMGDDLLNITDLAEEIAGKGGKIDNDGMVTLYHATDRESADIISNSGTMYGKEDRLFFSTKPDGQISGYGDAVIETKIPLEDLSLDDIFSDEAHLTINNKSGLGGSTPIRAKVLNPIPAVSGNKVRSALNELEIFQDVFPKSYKESIITPYTDRNIDPRTFSAGSGVGSSDPRVGQVDRNLATQIDIGDQRIPEVPLVSLNDYEGYPFMTTMSDRTAAGDTIRSINGVPVNVSRRGGQDYMLDPLNPEYVWASDESVVLKPKGDGLSDVSMFKFAQDMKARSGGKDTLFMPWTMAPTGGDFSQVGEVMLSYAKNNMGSDAAKALNNDIAKIIPNWKGLNDPMSIADFYAASGNRRKEVVDLMDKKYVHEGSLTSGQARLAMADEGQSMARDGNLRNIGVVDSDRYPYVGNPHPAYSTAMYGEGLGRIDNTMQVYELMPMAAMLGGLADVMRPPRANLRALEMKPYGGIITEDVLRGIEARRQTP